MAKSKSAATGGASETLRIGLLLLPPEGWKAQAWLEEEVARVWAGAGAAEIRAVRLKADPGLLGRTLRSWSGREKFDVVCVVGRSGHRTGDFTPEVTRGLLQRSLPGIEERMYLGPPRRPEDLLFRGAAGIRGETIIVNLPGRRGKMRSVLRFMAPVLGHALDKIGGDEGECARP
jgi:molybdopterin biosynthesis enzyme MoaB